MNFLIRAHLENATGYGQHVEHTARQLERRGHRVRCRDLNAPGPLPDFFAARLADSDDPSLYDHVIQLCPPFRPCPPGAIYATTWESDVLPPPCVAHLAPARLVIVNSEFIRAGFVASGVRPPVVVVPLGVAPDEYFPTAEPPTECRFGLVANLADSPRRKNVAGAVAAFRLAFPNTDADDVSLTIKLNARDAFDPPADPRIAVIRAHFTTAELRAFYNSLTALVSASLAEGFGLCPLQAMACARPAIATTYAGHAEYLDAAVGYPVAYDLVQPGWYEGGGTLALPSVGSLADQMRAVHADRPAAARKGLAARERARAFTWDRYGDRLLAAIG